MSTDYRTPERGERVTSPLLTGEWEVGLPGRGANKRFVWLLSTGEPPFHSILVPYQAVRRSSSYAAGYRQGKRARK